MKLNSNETEILWGCCAVVIGLGKQQTIPSILSFSFPHLISDTVSIRILNTQDPVCYRSLAFSPPSPPPAPRPAKSMMSAPVAMAECGASRNMPERGRRGTEDELPLLCFEGHAKTTHTVRTRHTGGEGRVKL